MENDVRKMGIINWSQIAPNKKGCRRATREALVFLE